ncbi:AAA family ATPase [Rhizobium sp. YIM 134829]|uniref:AAA family ATPase n=1 Tax=Rhizobium sp. YIM 134829 TaxID=3390453 RepID=UPI00397D3F82
MTTTEARIRQYLLARLRRHAVLHLYEGAAAVGLLESHEAESREGGAKRWIVAPKARRCLTGVIERDRQAVQRMMAGGRGRSVFADHDDAGWDRPSKVVGETLPRAADAAESDATNPTIAFSELADLLKEQLPAPNPMHVAVALLVARAVGTSLPDLSLLMGALGRNDAFILIKAPVKRFEMSLGLMLEDSLLLPYATRCTDVMREEPLSGRYKTSHRTPLPRRVFQTIAGTAVRDFDERRLRSRLRHAIVEETGPVVVVDETPDALTPVLSATADLVLACGGFDRAMLADLLHLCLRFPVERSLAQMEAVSLMPERLSIDDIVLAVRRGRSLEDVVRVMVMLIERFSNDEHADGRTGSRGHRDRRGSSNQGRNAPAGSEDNQTPSPAEVGVEILEPDATQAATLTSLTGYGLAGDWANDLAVDLALWRAGTLAWSEMSTRLLLSGPPGTGKTTFARALSTTLQVPLMSTSVAHWLEPAHLGDVLKRMTAAFALASARAPAILFIDEIDNIGSRQSASNRSHDDYWATLINRLLQLLDGATRTEGVVVVAATNLPDKIDPALLRSGRLETHVRIPLPDLEALGGILAHHLGKDLEAVLSSAPGKPAYRLKPRPGIDDVPGRLRRVSENRKAKGEEDRKP